MAMKYYYVASDDQPMLVKWNDDVSYLPIFEEQSQALAWARTLNSKTLVTPFTFSVACAARERMRKSGHMVFVLPACPNEFK